MFWWYDDVVIWGCDDMVIWWYDDIMTWSYNDMMIGMRSGSCAEVLRRCLAQALRLIFRCVLRGTLRRLARLIFRWLIFSIKYSSYWWSVLVGIGGACTSLDAGFLDRETADCISQVQKPKKHPIMKKMRLQTLDT